MQIAYTMTCHVAAVGLLQLASTSAFQVKAKELDPTLVITHIFNGLDRGSEAYKLFNDKRDGCIKVRL